MTITLTAEQVYIGIIVFLMVLQVVQWVSIKKLQREVEQIWGQIAIVAATLSYQVNSIQKPTTQENDTEQQA